MWWRDPSSALRPLMPTPTNRDHASGQNTSTSGTAPRLTPHRPPKLPSTQPNSQTPQTRIPSCLQSQNTFPVATTPPPTSTMPMPMPLTRPLPPIRPLLTRFDTSPQSLLFKAWVFVGVVVNWIILFITAHGALQLEPRQVGVHGFFFVPVCTRDAFHPDMHTSCFPPYVASLWTCIACPKIHG